MNRRTVLRSAGALVTVSLSGCLGAFRDHFEGELKSPIPIEILNEGDQYYNVKLDAYERGTDRHIYDEGYAIRSGESVRPPHLGGTEQLFVITKRRADFEIDVTERVAVAPGATVVSVIITDDDLDVTVRWRDGGDDTSESSVDSA